MSEQLDATNPSDIYVHHHHHHHHRPYHQPAIQSLPSQLYTGTSNGEYPHFNNPHYDSNAAYSPYFVERQHQFQCYLHPSSFYTPPPATNQYTMISPFNHPETTALCHQQQQQSQRFCNDQLCYFSTNDGIATQLRQQRFTYPHAATRTATTVLPPPPPPPPPPPTTTTTKTTTNSQYYYDVQELSASNHQQSSIQQPTRPKQGRQHKRKRPRTNGAAEEDKKRVYIWDLDGVILGYLDILRMNDPCITRIENMALSSHQLLKPKSPGDLVQRMEELINQFCVKHLNYVELKPYEQMQMIDGIEDFLNIEQSIPCDNDGLSTLEKSRDSYDLKMRIATRIRSIVKFYGKEASLEAIELTKSQYDFSQLLERMNLANHGWTQHARSAIEMANGREDVVNVLVTNSPLIPALCKLMIFDFTDYFPVDTVYSSTVTGKKQCFERIETKYGKDLIYVVVGRGEDERIAAQEASFYP
ncbi:hypothetical protein ACOME3_009217 [Neoechinorhynchus agilis]